MSGEIQWPAPAKLNLFLHITGRRADGYHQLQTLFQLLDVGDTIAFTPNASGALRRVTAVAGVAAEDDLCVRAARLLQQAAGVSQGIDIALTKRIPLGGGLGGGSSDAATTLLALNSLWDLRWSLQELAALGLQLGADVPVFIHGHSAWAEGVGEVLTPVELAPTVFVILRPPTPVATAAAFSAFAQARASQLTPYSAPITIRDFHAGHTRNDLEASVRRGHPEVDKALNWLSQFGAARMTGSGACVFLPVATLDAARIILQQSQQLGRAYTGFIAQGVNRHPLHAQLGHTPYWGVAKR